MPKPSVYRKTVFWLNLLGVCATVPAFSQTGHWYAGASYGQGTAHVSNSHDSITYYQGYLNDAYPLAENEVSTGVASLNGGYEWPAIGPAWPAIAVGLGVYTTPNSYHYQGQVNETALGMDTMDLYDYQLQLSSTRLMLETTFTWTVAQHWKPYAELGIGRAFNTVSNYSETPITSNGFSPGDPFQAKTTSNMAYQAGLGLGYDFNFDDFNTFDSGSSSGFQHERIKVGYRWVDSGSASTGIRGTAYPYSLDLGTVTSQELYVSYTHFF